MTTDRSTRVPTDTILLPIPLIRRHGELFTDWILRVLDTWQRSEPWQDGVRR
jgi:hypothetical protein